MKNKTCKNCNRNLLFIPHYEYDGVTEHGNFEPYWECPKGCAYPECKDNDLTASELMERGKVDTCTEYGIINFWQWSKAVII